MSKAEELIQRSIEVKLAFLAEGGAVLIEKMADKVLEALRAGKSGFCFECDTFPCARLRRLDKRYRTKYRMSMIENLEVIRDSGVESFVESERERWACPECGGMQCVHTDVCVYCDHAWD